MTLEGFLSERRPSWTELEELLERSKGKPERLGAAGILRFGELYRGAAADLAVARRRFPSEPERRHLESLVGRAAIVVYEPATQRTTALRYLSRGYWQAIAERPAPVASAWLLLLVPALLAAVWAYGDPGSALSFVPADFRAAADPPSDAGYTAAQQAVFSSDLFTHNIQVTFTVFALGITAGIGTSLLIAYQGLLLGAIVGLALEAGNGRALSEFLVPHGPLELSCIVVAGAAGLRLGWALVDPGTATRAAALASEGRRVVGIVLGTMPWLVVAGIVEAFVRSNGLPPGVLAVVGIGLFATFWGLVLTRGRPRSDADAREAPPGSRASPASRAAPATSLAGSR